MIEELKEQIAITIHFGMTPEEDVMIGKQDKQDALKYWGGVSGEILTLFQNWLEKELDGLGVINYQDI